jgi:hypothetical protein
MLSRHFILTIWMFGSGGAFMSWPTKKLIHGGWPPFFKRQSLDLQRPDVLAGPLLRECDVQPPFFVAVEHHSCLNAAMCHC